MLEQNWEKVSEHQFEKQLHDTNMTWTPKM